MGTRFTGQGNEKIPGSPVACVSLRLVPRPVGLQSGLAGKFENGRIHTGELLLICPRLEYKLILPY